MLGTLPALLRRTRRTQRRVAVDVVTWHHHGRSKESKVMHRPLDSQVREEPLIWVVDGLCEQQQVQQLKELLKRQKLDTLQKTATW